MSLLQEEILEYLTERRWNKLEPSNIAKSISIEAAELLEHFQWENHTAKEIIGNKAKLADIRSEVADVIIYAIEACIMLDLSFEDVVRDKLAAVREKYPVKEVRADPENYRRIKRQYRKLANS